MATERLILDPTELTNGERTELDVTPWIDVEGIDWGSAEVEAYKAEAQIGESVIDSRLPNRQITAPMVLKEQGGTSFAKARSYIQAKAALGQREGLIGKRILATGGTVYFDIVSNGLTLSGNWLQANKSFDTDAELRLEAIPDFYEPEELIAEAEEKTATELIKVIPDPGGDMPARVRLVVEEKQGADQRGLIWSFRSRYYSEASTAKTTYEAEELQALGEAAAGSLTGASNGTAISHTALPAIWTPVVGTNIGGTGFLTHKGTNRVFARLRSPDGTAVSARLVWDVGDLVNPSENAAWAFPAGSAFYVADLGEIRLDPAPVGTHRWQGQIQAKGTEGGEDINVDKVWIVNTDEGMGILSAPLQASTGELKAWDSFNQTAGNLDAPKALPLGGNWSEASKTGENGFKINATSHVAERAKADETATVTAGCYALAGTAEYSGVSVGVTVEASPSTAFGPILGVIARYIDTSNWIMAVVAPNAGTDSRCECRVLKLVAGKGEYLVYGQMLPSTPERIEFTINDVGVWLARFGNLERTGFDSVLATGGTLAKGKVGMYDTQLEASAITRTYDNFSVTSSAPDAAIFASQKAQLTTRGMYRLDSGGSAYGPISRVIGDLPRLPAGNLEGRSAELFLKGSRGDIGEVADPAIDDIAVKVYASRSWLTVPGTI